jgi:hypothetical protein
MSPRAAWQLEALGLTDVHDFMSGKAEWIAHGLPVEGKGPHYPLVGEVARRDIVHECRLGSKVGESRIAVAESRLGYCVVLNDHDVPMGVFEGSTSKVATRRSLRTSWKRARPQFDRPNRPPRCSSE